ncbi:hypothetical protein SYNPS1DRAFT_21756, partial [Syncephalis pseudoplumigaleata]
MQASASYCPLCKTTSAAKETLDSGDLVCTACGAVLSEWLLDDRLPAGEQTRLDRSATVYATQLKQRPHIRGITHQRVSGANEERAWHIFTRCLDHKIGILPRLLLCAACILYVVRESGQSMSLADVAALVNSNVTSVRRAYAQVERFIKESSEHTPQPQPSSSSTILTPSMDNTDPTRFLPSKLVQLQR